MSLRKGAPLAIAALLLCHAMVLFAGFFAPYSPEMQYRLLAFAPPTYIHFVDTQGRLHIRPFMYRWAPLPGSLSEFREDRNSIHPVHFFVPGGEYKILGLFASRMHLFGTDKQAPVFLIGTDAYGRDQFSRLLYGGRISLFTGLLAAAIAVALGLCLGGIAGYYGGLVDDAFMRGAEIFLAMPWLYLLLAVRAALPLHIAPEQAFVLLIAVLGVVGWARPARLIRGVVLSAKQREYVLAARGFGASDLYILRRHVLPQAFGVALNQAALYIPQFILAEVTLSFFGLGVSEPAPSWGNMLAGLQRYYVLESCWWMFAPAVALVAVLLAYYRMFSCYVLNTPRV